ncbi:unnamed protein product [Calicophoron daubneyi]|uniref:Uncharacterized protein n=1 Tax=Calicophoron daubneyi TaxID=300641 RepID=A0AAV2TH57_CALDB
MRYLLLLWSLLAFSSLVIATRIDENERYEKEDSHQGTPFGENKWDVPAIKTEMKDDHSLRSRLERNDGKQKYRRFWHKDNKPEYGPSVYRSDNEYGSMVKKIPEQEIWATPIFPGEPNDLRKLRAHPNVDEYPYGNYLHSQKRGMDENKDRTSNNPDVSDHYYRAGGTENEPSDDFTDAWNKWYDDYPGRPANTDVERSLRRLEERENAQKNRLPRNRYVSPEEFEREYDKLRSIARKLSKRQ